MDFERGLSNLDSVLKRAGLAPDSEEYLNFVGWHRQLQTSVEDERRFAVLSPREQERRERILRELDRLALRFTDKVFLDLCAEKTSSLSPQRPAEAAHKLTTIFKSSDSNESHFPNSHALLIGVGDHMHSRFASLPATVRDALAVAAVLTEPTRCGYPPDSVQLVTGEEATAANIRAALMSLAESTNSQSTVFLYFSGHGGRALENGNWRTYLCPREANPDDLVQTAISGDEFSTLLAAIPARKLLVMLDACHAAGSADLKATDGNIVWKAGLSDDYFEALSQGSGRVVIASSKAEQVSYVRGELSLFTQHLVQALNGKAAVRGDGLIHVLDVFHYVNEAVQTDEPKQVPILKVKDLDLNFAIALDRGGKGVGLAPAVPDIAAIREQIVRDPIAGAKALSDYLATRPGLSAKRNEVDLKRSDLERTRHDLELFGPNDSDKAAWNRGVFFLLRVCLELAEQ